MQYNGKHKNQIFGPRMGSCNLPELAQQREQHKNVVFLVFSHDGDEKIGGVAQKIDLQPKNSVFGPKKATLVKGW